MTPRNVLILVASVVLIVHAGESDSIALTDTNMQRFFCHLAATGRSNQAMLEYRRLQHSRAIIDPGAACNLAEALLRDGDLTAAEKIYDELLERPSTDLHTGTVAKLGLIRTYLLQRKPYLAQNELATFDHTTPLEKNAADFYRSVVYAATYQTDSSKEMLSSIPETSSLSSKAKRLATLMDSYKTSGLKNPLTAYLYSSALPGLGHWYLGDKRKAVKSFLLMAGLSTLIGYESYRFYRSDTDRRFVYGMDIFLIWGLAWRRYYGSIRKAAHQQAITSNQQVQLEYQHTLHAIISE